MKKSAGSLTFCAMIATISIILLYISVLWPTMRLTFAAFAGMLPAAVILRYGLLPGFLTYIACAALSLILLPVKDSALFYTAIFGYYPVIKSLAERHGNLILRWAIKLFVFNIAYFILYFIFSAVFTGYLDSFLFGLPLFTALSNFAFIIYDIGFSKLIYWYENRIARYIK